MRIALTEFSPEYNPYFYPECAGIAVVFLLVYWFIWKRNAVLANILVFGSLVGLLVYLTDWDYILNHYIRINWKMP